MDFATFSTTIRSADYSDLDRSKQVIVRTASGEEVVGELLVDDDTNQLVIITKEAVDTLTEDDLITIGG